MPDKSNPIAHVPARDLVALRTAEIAVARAARRAANKQAKAERDKLKASRSEAEAAAAAEDQKIMIGLLAEERARQERLQREQDAERKERQMQRAAARKAGEAKSAPRPDHAALEQVIGERMRANAQAMRSMAKDQRLAFVEGILETAAGAVYVAWREASKLRYQVVKGRYQANCAAVEALPWSSLSGDAGRLVAASMIRDRAVKHGEVWGTNLAEISDALAVILKAKKNGVVTLADALKEAKARGDVPEGIRRTLLPEKQLRALLLQCGRCDD
jgi:hypothetical protein